MTEKSVYVILVSCMLLLPLPFLRRAVSAFSSPKNPQKFSCTFDAIHLLLKMRCLCSGTNHGCSQIHKTALTILWKLSLTNFKNRSERNHWPEVFFLV